METKRAGGNVGAQQARLFERAPHVSPSTGARAEAPSASPSVASGGTNATRTVLGDVKSPAPQRRESAGASSSKLGIKLADQGMAPVLRNMLRAALVSLSMLGGQAVLNPTMADTVFLDHNNAPMEIKIAKQLAAEVGEKFVLVRPDAASLDSVFAQAERGELDIRHLILSGHSSGQRVWGNGADGTRHESSIDEYKALKAKYPNAFAQVKHVHFMACYAGNAGNSAAWSAVFPNAKAIAGFWGSGPSKTQPAAQKMLASSERHLRTLDKKQLSPQQALVEAKRMANMQGSNVTKFAVRLEGVHYSLGEAKTNVDVAQDRVNLLHATAFEPWMNPVGQTAEFHRTPENHQTSPLRDYYVALQAYLGAVEPGSWQATQTQERIETTIRLIYFDVLAARMQTEHGALFGQVNADLQAAGLDARIPDDLGKASRLQIVEAAKALGAVPDASLEGAAAERLTKAKELLGKGLRDLSPSVIPAGWIE